MSDRRAARRAAEAQAVVRDDPAVQPGPAPRRGWALFRRRGVDAGLCALMGPAGAGKTTFLRSLEREPELACSHPARLLARPAREPEPQSGLELEIERPGQRPRGMRLREAAHEEMQPQALRRTRSVLLLLPAHGPEDARARRRLLTLVAALAEPGARRARLVLCLSKYELLFRRDGRAALSRAADPRTARDALAWSLSADGPYGFLRPALTSLAARRKLWAQPVSAFGFVAGEGGANVSPEGERRRTEWLARLAAGGEAREAAVTGRSDEARENNPVERPAEPLQEPSWRPFLTHDALLLAACDTPGRLSFLWRDVA